MSCNFSLDSSARKSCRSHQIHVYPDPTKDRLPWCPEVQQLFVMIIEEIVDSQISLYPFVDVIGRRQVPDVEARHGLSVVRVVKSLTDKAKLKIQTEWIDRLVADDCRVLLKRP